MNESICVAEMMLAISENDIDKLVSIFEDYKALRLVNGDGEFVDGFNIVLDCIRKVLKSSGDDKRNVFYAFIDKLTIEENEKLYFKYSYKLNNENITIEEKEQIINDLKTVAPLKYERDVDIMELNVAIIKVNLDKIRTILLKIQGDM